MDPSTGIFNYLFTQGILGVVCVALIIVVVYQQKKSDKKDEKIDALNAQLLAENKSHTLDYREMAKDNQEVLQSNSQNMALFGAKIEVAKGRR
jgi:molybdopterin biosynthesis enzyme MoaB